MNKEALQALAEQLQADLEKTAAALQDSQAQQLRILGAIDAVKYIISQTADEPAPSSLDA